MRGNIIPLLSVIGFVIIGYFIERENFQLLIIVYSILFGSFLLLVNANLSIKKILILGILFRLSFIASTPALSDDYNRFIWDGRILASGNNPYLILPNQSLDNDIIIQNDLDKNVYTGLNSKQYYTIYPPINQVFFAAATLLGNNNISIEIMLLRLIIILFEIGVLFIILKLLKHYNQDLSKIAFYALNPLVIIELSGNLHFEGVMLFFILLSVWLWFIKKPILSPVALALGIGVKLIPLMLLPIVFTKLSFKKAFIFCAIAGISVLLFFSPFINSELITNFASSLDLYFRKFEFNSSIFYLIKEVGEIMVGYDIIQKAGPIMSIVVLAIILIIIFQSKLFKNNIFEKFVVILTVYLLFATTVHPWYITTIVGLSIMTNMRFPIFWSYLVFLSYSHYNGGGYNENYLLIFIEYAGLIFIIGYETFILSKGNTKIHT